MLGSGQDMYTRSLLAAGTALPKISAKTVQGKQFDLGAALRGKRGGVLYFWHLGSKASTEAVPQIAQVQASNRDVAVILVNHGDDPARVKEFLGNGKIELPCMMSSPEGDNVAKAFGVTGFPTVYTFSTVPSVVSAMYKPSGEQLAQAVSALGR